jgi:hypothetical protein
MPRLPLHSLFAIQLLVFLHHIPLVFSRPCRTGAPLGIPVHHGGAAETTVPSPAPLRHG